MNEEIIDNEVLPVAGRRRKLLPVWIKIFLWLFMITGFIAPLGLIIGIFDINFRVSLYGLETTKALSPIGISLIVLFAIKGIVSLGLWNEKNWAVKLAIVDAVIGLIVCVTVMLVLPFLIVNNGVTINLRLELIALIPYLIKMVKIRREWESLK